MKVLEVHNSTGTKSKINFFILREFICEITILAKYMWEALIVEENLVDTLYKLSLVEYRLVIF